MGKVCTLARWMAVFSLLTACGDDDSATESTPAAIAPAPGADSSDASTDAATDMGMAASAAADPSAPAMGIDFGQLANMIIPMCDTSETSVTECGGTACPGVNALASLACTVNCCVEGMCGTRTAALTVLPSTECIPPAVPDDNCPDTTLGPITLEGCCLENDTCGLITFGACTPPVDAMGAIAASMPQALPADGGIPADGGMAIAAGDAGMGVPAPAGPVACDSRAARPADAGMPDVAMPDAATPDAAVPGAPMPDAAVPDAMMP